MSPEETGNGGGNGDDEEEPGPQWDQRLTFTNVTDGAWLNLTITAGSDALTNFTVKLLDPTGAEAASVDMDFEDGAGTFNATWGNATPQAETHLDVKEGRWTYEVWAEDRVTVATNFVPIEEGVIIV